MAPQTGTPRETTIPSTSGPRPVTVHGLVVPADPQRSVGVRELALIATALSDAIGGGLLDEALHGVYLADEYTVYLDDGRLTLPPNDRAAVLSARLGCTERRWLEGLRGDALILGRSTHDDSDVPASILDAARAAGLFPEPRPT